jgi:hypothetical protein
MLAGSSQLPPRNLAARNDISRSRPSPPGSVGSSQLSHTPSLEMVMPGAMAPGPAGGSIRRITGPAAAAPGSPGSWLALPPQAGKSRARKSAEGRKAVVRRWERVMGRGVYSGAELGSVPIFAVRALSEPCGSDLPRRSSASSATAPWS